MYQAATVMNHGAAGFNAILYGDKNPMINNYILNNIASIQNVVTDAGNSFLESAKALYNRFNSDEAINLTKSIIRNAKNLFVSDVIREIIDIDKLIAATPMMQRFNMANPILRDLYLHNKIDGYSDSYVNIHGNAIGETHHDYRMVMDGVPVDTDYGWKINFYPDEQIENDVVIGHHEKVSILNTWETITTILETSSIDPTSIFGMNKAN
jgi:hypothetical protein